MVLGMKEGDSVMAIFHIIFFSVFTLSIRLHNPIKADSLFSKICKAYKLDVRFQGCVVCHIILPPVDLNLEVDVFFGRAIFCMSFVSLHGSQN